MQERKTPTSKLGGRGFSVAFSKSAQQISTPLLKGLVFAGLFLCATGMVMAFHPSHRPSTRQAFGLGTFIFATLCGHHQYMMSAVLGD